MNFYITGYRDYELGVFNMQDPKVAILKTFLRQQLLYLIDRGVTWFLFAGNLGIEYYAFEVSCALKDEGYDIRTAVIFPFENFGQQWSERNKEKLQTYHMRADYVNSVFHSEYKGPWQLKRHTQFLLQHTAGTWMLYSDDIDSKVSYFLEDAQQFQLQHDYIIEQQTLEDVQMSMESFD